MFKRILQIFLTVALAVQLTGCFYRGDDHRWHGGHRESPHDSGIDVHVHG